MNKKIEKLGEVKTKTYKRYELRIGSESGDVIDHLPALTHNIPEKTWTFSFRKFRLEIIRID